MGTHSINFLVIKKRGEFIKAFDPPFQPLPTPFVTPLNKKIFDSKGTPLVFQGFKNVLTDNWQVPIPANFSVGKIVKCLIYASKWKTNIKFRISMAKNPRVPILPIFEICRFFAEKFAGPVNWNSAPITYDTFFRCSIFKFFLLLWSYSNWSLRLPKQFVQVSVAHQNDAKGDVSFIKSK